MAYNPNKELKLYYSIGEVAKMFDVTTKLGEVSEGAQK